MWPQTYVTSQDGIRFTWIPGGAVRLTQGSQRTIEHRSFRKKPQQKRAALPPEQRNQPILVSGADETARLSSQRRMELSARCAVVDLHADRHRRGPVHLRFRHRLHARRPGLLSLLRLHGPVHVFDARAGDGLELPDDVCRLGRRRSLFLPADRLLLRSPGSGQRFAQGVHHQSHRRLRFRARDLWRDRDVRHRAIHRRFRPGAELIRWSRWDTGACCRGLRSDFSSAPAASLHNCRCTSGCRTRWLVQLRSRR